MKSKKTVFRLDNTSIDGITQEISQLFQAMELERRNALRLTLSLEEILLRWQDRFGTGQEAVLDISSRFGQQYMSLAVTGEPCNPLEQSDDSWDWNARLLENIGLAPSYSYRRGTNTVVLKLKQNEDSSTKHLLMGMAAAAVLGFAGILFFPELAASAVDSLLYPFRSALMGLLSAAAVPMIFLSILLSVCGIGDVTTFSRVGSTMLRRFLTTVFISTLAVTLLCAPLFSLNISGGKVETDQLSAALEMLLDILPNSLFEPFVVGNTLQLMVIAAGVGMAILILGDRAKTVKLAAEELNSIVYLLLDWIGQLIPYMVFLLLLEMFWSGNYMSMLSIWKPMLLSALVSIFMLALYMLRVSRRYKISLSRLIRKITPVALILIATGSSTAAYSTDFDCCKKNLGIDEKIVGFGLPVGHSFFNVPLCSWFLLCAFYGAEHYGIEVSAVWLFVAWISAALLGSAAPTVTGGAFACYSIFFTQLGIPVEAIASMIAVDVIVDRINTTSKVLTLEMELILISDKLDYLDKDTLTKD